MHPDIALGSSMNLDFTMASAVIIGIGLGMALLEKMCFCGSGNEKAASETVFS